QAELGYRPTHRRRAHRIAVPLAHFGHQLSNRPIRLLGDESRDLSVLRFPKLRRSATAVRLRLDAALATEPLHEAVDRRLTDGKPVSDFTKCRGRFLVRGDDASSKIDRKWLRHIYVRSEP